MNTSARIVKVTHGTRITINPLFQKSGSLKVSIVGTGESKHIPSFLAKLAFVEIPHVCSEPGYQVIPIPHSSKLFKVETGFDYEDTENPDPENLWVTAKFFFWHKEPRPLFFFRVSCVPAVHLNQLEPPEGTIFQ
ncbi:MAG: hypothetical protein RLZZ480_285 [Candidatus Parcubacteria bacterium]|jgi:hypothetical protein